MNVLTSCRKNSNGVFLEIRKMLISCVKLDHALTTACMYFFAIHTIDGEQLAPVENVTVTNVGPTSFTVQWNVSIN